MKKKLFALLVALCMISSIMPVSGVHNHAQADDVCTHEGYEVKYVQSTTAHQHVLHCVNCNDALYGGTAVGCSDYKDYDGKCDNCGGEMYCYGGEATCTEKANCLLCGKSYGQTPTGHDWKNYKGECTQCGEHHIHTGCGETDYVCETCGYSARWEHPDYYPTDGHCDACGECLDGGNSEYVSMKSDATHHWWEHTCGKIHSGYEVHTWVDGKCTECEYQCAHAKFVYAHNDGTEGYEATHDWYCPDCGYVLVDDALCYNSDTDGDGNCDNCKYEYDHKNHRGGTATCTEPAVCEICKQPYGESLGHQNIEYEHIEGTEGGGSMHKGTCLCGEVIFSMWYCADTDNDHMCDKCGYAVSEHNFVAESDGAGQHTMMCDYCGLKTYSAYCEDYTGDGKCDKCDYALELTKPEEHEHEYNFDAKPQSTGEGEHFYTCTCGDAYTMKCSDYSGDGLCDSCGYELYHAGGTPTCNKQNICQNCGEPYGEVLDHIWSNKDGVCARGCGEICSHPNETAVSNGKGQHMLECPDCGHNYDGLLLNCELFDNDFDGKCDSCGYEVYHTGGTATCAEQAVCQHCGLPYGELLPHTWQMNEEETTLNVEAKSFKVMIDCAECGEKALPFGFGYNAETELVQAATCELPELTKFSTSGNVKGVAFELEETVETAPATGEHDYEVVREEAANCQSPAYKWYKCTVCGAEKNGEEGGLGEHDYEVVREEAANCQYPAYKWYKCTVCGAEKNGEEGGLGDHVNNDGDKNCDVCGEKLVIDCDHIGMGTYSVTVEANCSKEGTVEVCCKNCDEVLTTETLEKNDSHVFINGTCLLCGGAEEELSCDHEGKGTYTFTVEATCSKEGSVEVFCKSCGELISKDTMEKNDNHVFINGTCLLCGGAEEEVSCTHEGKGTYTFTVEATCVKDGSVEVYCKSCGELVSKETLEKNDNHFFYNGICLVCGEAEKQECEHDYELVKEQAADCQYPAYKWYECSICGAEKNGEEGGLGEHDYEVVREEAATCQYPAYKWYECTVCGAEKNGEEGGLGEHDYEVVCEEAATCQYPAYKWYECSLCGAEKNGEEGGLGEHDYEVVREEAATCQYPAYKWYECTVCGAEKNGEEGGLGEHDYEVVREEAATCQYPAYKWYECSLCGAEKNGEEGGLGEHDYEVVREEAATCQYPAYYWYECTVCGAEKNGEEGAPDASAHNWDAGKVTTEPTVDAEGVKTFTCTACGESKTETIDKLTHVHDYKSVVTAPTCTEAGYTTFSCACGDSYTADEVAATGHSGTVNIIPATCTEIGYGKGVCDICGETFFYQEIPVKGHTEETVAGKDATCTAAGLTAGIKCSVCGETLKAQEEIPAKGHTEETVAGKDATCTAAGLTAGTKCSVCGETVKAQEEIPAKGHTEETVAGKDATCTAAGLTAGTKCSVCGETVKAQEEIPAKGHTEETVAGKDATCTAAGLTAGTKCSVCGETVKAQAEIPAKGHNYTVHWEFNEGITEKYEVSTCTDCGYVHEEGPFACEH